MSTLNSGKMLRPAVADAVFHLAQELQKARLLKRTLNVENRFGFDRLYSSLSADFLKNVQYGLLDRAEMPVKLAGAILADFVTPHRSKPAVCLKGQYDFTAQEEYLETLVSLIESRELEEFWGYMLDYSNQVVGRDEIKYQRLLSVINALRMYMRAFLNLKSPTGSEVYESLLTHIASKGEEYMLYSHSMDVLYSDYVMLMKHPKGRVFAGQKFCSTIFVMPGDSATPCTLESRYEVPLHSSRRAA